MLLLLLLLLASMYVRLDVENAIGVVMPIREGNGPVRDYTLRWPKLWFG